MNFRRGASVRTAMTTDITADGETVFRIAPAEGDLSLIPEERSYQVCVYGVEAAKNATATILCGNEQAEAALAFDADSHVATVFIPATSVQREITVTFHGLSQACNDFRSEVFRLMDEAWCSTLLKEQVFDHARDASPEAFAAYLAGADIPPIFREALEELLD